MPVCSVLDIIIIIENSQSLGERNRYTRCIWDPGYNPYNKIIMISLFE